MLARGKCDAQSRLTIGSAGVDVGTKIQKLLDADFASEIGGEMQSTEATGITLIRIDAALQKRFGQTAPAKMDGLQQGRIMFFRVFLTHVKTSLFFCARATRT